jgi:hypothetical protein
MTAHLDRAPAVATLTMAVALVIAILDASRTVAATSEDRELFAIRVVGERAEVPPIEDIADRLQRDLGVDLEPNVIGARLGILVFTRPAHLPRVGFARSLDRWLSGRPKLVKLTVRSLAQGYTVQTGRIIIEFAPHVTPEAAQAALQRFKLAIVERPTWFRQTRYIAESHDSGQGLNALVQTLARTPDVAFAEPDLLMVSYAREPIAR